MKLQLLVAITSLATTFSAIANLPRPIAISDPVVALASHRIEGRVSSYYAASGKSQGSGKWVSIRKLQTDGRALWEKRLGSNHARTRITIADISVGSDASVYALGYFNGQIGLTATRTRRLEFQSLGQSSNLFVLKLNRQGQFQWMKIYYNADNREVTVNAIAVRGNTVAIVGRFQKRVMERVLPAPQSPTVVLEQARGTAAYILKLNARTGRRVLASRYGTSDPRANTSIQDLGFDSAGNVVVGGFTSVSFQTPSATPNVVISISGQPNRMTAFAMKLNSQGNAVWGRTYAEGNTTTSAISVDEQNNVYFAGNIDQSSPRVFIQKCASSTGRILWTRLANAAPAPGVRTVNAISINDLLVDQGKVYLVGGLAGRFSFGEGSRQQRSLQARRANKLDSFLWAITVSGENAGTTFSVFGFGSSANDQVLSIARSSGGGVLLGGEFEKGSTAYFHPQGQRAENASQFRLRSPAPENERRRGNVGFIAQFSERLLRLGVR